MKKICLFILVIYIFFPISTSAKSTKYIGIGVTRATLRSEGGKSEWGKFIGFGLEYSRPSSLLFAIEAAYTTKKITLENKSWQSDSELHHSGKSIGDITYDGSFLELATKIGYHIPRLHSHINIKLFVGPTLSLHYRYVSHVKERKHLWYDEEEGPYEFDYIRCEDEGLIPNISIDGIIGAIISYKTIGVEVHYARSSKERTCISGLTINGKLDSFYILLRYSF